MNKDKFLKKAILKYKNKYDYSLINLINWTTPVQVGCPIHGVFYQTPGWHLNPIAKYGCPSCYAAVIQNNVLKDKENFIRLSSLKHKVKYDYSLVTYKNNKTKVKIICPIHGHFLQKPNTHSRGGGCPKCSYISRFDSRRIPVEDFLIRFKTT